MEGAAPEKSSVFPPDGVQETENTNCCVEGSFLPTEKLEATNGTEIVPGVSWGTPNTGVPPLFWFVEGTQDPLVDDEEGTHEAPGFNQNVGGWFTQRTCNENVTYLDFIVMRFSINNPTVVV